MKPALPLAIAAITVLAAGCSPAKDKADAPAKAAPAAAAAAAADQAEPAAATAENADGAVWTFFQTEEGTHLAFTVPESDDTANYLVCQTGSGQINASMWADHAIPGEPSAEARTETTQLTLSSGSTSKAYEAAAEGEEMYGGAQVTAMNIGLNDPVIAAFARTGVIQMSAYGKASSMPAVKTSDVQKFLAACKKAD